MRFDPRNIVDLGAESRRMVILKKGFQNDAKALKAIANRKPRIDAFWTQVKKTWIFSETDQNALNSCGPIRDRVAKTNLSLICGK